MGKKHISKSANRFALISFLTVFVNTQAVSGEMPKNPSIQSGNVTIEGKGTNHLKIQQKTNKSIINWDSFSVHKGGRVDFNMPSTRSSSLNRVTGSTPSTIAGQINSNGKVLLINPNGVAITKNGVVKTGSFAASTLDIKNNDFLKDIYSFKRKNNSKGVEISGKIIVGSGGNASLLGGYVSNSGTIMARLGKVSLGSGDKITLDFVGDGLMKVTVPTKQLGLIRDTKGRPLSSLIRNTGIIKANGGLIELSAHTAQALSRGSVNIGSSGMIIAQSVGDKSGKVVIGSPKDNNIKISGKIDVSAPIKSLSPSGTIIIQGRNVTHTGNIYANGRSGGKVKVLSKDNIKIDGSVFAKGNQETGGNVVFLSENEVKITEKAIVNATGQNKGGTIRSLAKTANNTSGTLNASSRNGYGGKVDVTGDSVQVSSANINASGKLRGGKVRIGGEYLGGKLTTKDNNYKGFVTRFGDQPQLDNAKHTVVKADTNIDVSSQTGKGGTAVIWSDQLTEFDGQINAKGAEKILVSANLNEKSKLGESIIDSPKTVNTKIQTKIESKADPPPPKALKSQSK